MSDIYQKYKKHMNIIIDENKERSIIGKLLTEIFCPSSEKVNVIKDYLDKHFSKTAMDDIDSDGYPKKSFVAMMLSSDKQPIKTITPKELLLILDDKFEKAIADKDDRRKFLKQIIIDWFNNKIDRTGILSVNIIK